MTDRRAAMWTAAAEALRRQREAGAIPHRPTPWPVPLTDLQAALWPNYARDLNRSPAVTYTVPIDGPLDVPALTAAVAEVYRVQEALRTRFAMIDRVPMQQVGPVPDEPLALIDRRAQLGAGEIETWARSMEACTVNLASGPPSAAALVPASDTRHMLLIAFHHLCFDGWSLPLYARQLRDAYESQLAGSTNGLAEPPVQLTDIAQWQQEDAYRQIAAQELQYWRGSLRGLDEAPRLLPEQFRPGTGGTARQYEMPAELLEALRATRAASGDSLFTIMLAAFKACMRRETGAEDVCIEALVANRSRPEMLSLIGPCANVALLRTEVSGDPQFDDLVGRVSQTVRGALAHVQVSARSIFDPLVGEGCIPQVCSRIQVDWQTIPAETLRFGEATLGEERAPIRERQLRTATGGPMTASLPDSLDLILHFQELRRGLRLLVIHRPDHVTAEDLDRLIDGYWRLLGAGVASPGRRMSAL